MIAIRHEWLMSAFQWTLNTSVLGSFLIVVILCTRLLVRDALPARWVYALWIIVVLRFALPIVPESSWSIYNLVEPDDPAPVTVIRMPLPEVSPEHQALIDEHGWDQPPRTVDIALQSIIPVWVGPRITIDGGRSYENFPVTLRRRPEPAIPLKNVLPYIWLAGVLIVGLAVAVRSLAVSKRLSKGKVLDTPEWDAALRQAKAQMGVGRTVRLLETKAVHSPALYGLLHLRILIPPHLVERLSPEQRRFVLLHELAHVKRQDIAMNWLVAALQALHWFNPLVWVAFRLMRNDRETACDALVLTRLKPNQNVAYGSTLLSLVEGAIKPSRVPGMVGILETKSNVYRRIGRIALFRRTSIGWSIASLLFISTLAFVTLTNAQVEERAALEKSVPQQAEKSPQAPRPVGADVTETKAQAIVRELIEKSSGAILNIQAEEMTFVRSGSGTESDTPTGVFSGNVVVTLKNATASADRARITPNKVELSGNVHIPELRSNGKSVEDVSIRTNYELDINGDGVQESIPIYTRPDGTNIINDNVAARPSPERDAPSESIPEPSTPTNIDEGETPTRILDLGEAPFGAFIGFRSEGLDTFGMTRKTDGATIEIRSVYPRGNVVAVWEDAIVFADRAGRVGDRFRFEGNVRIPELWGDSESADVVELGPKLPEWYSFNKLPDRVPTTANAVPRANRRPLADRQRDPGPTRRKGSRYRREKPASNPTPVVESVKEPRTLQERLDANMAFIKLNDVPLVDLLALLERELHVPLYDAVNGERIPIRQSDRLRTMIAEDVALRNVPLADVFSSVLRPFDLLYAVYDDFVAIGSAAELKKLRDSEGSRIAPVPGERSTTTSTSETGADQLGLEGVFLIKTEDDGIPWDERILYDKLMPIKTLDAIVPAKIEKRGSLIVPKPPAQD